MGVECGVRLACDEYALFGIDYEEHGRSEGARCYIKKIDNIVNNCYNFFKSSYKSIRVRLDSCMGGAVSLVLHKKDPSLFWDGAVLVAPIKIDHANGIKLIRVTLSTPLIE
ncbi:Caffeoylshikimate esterase [Glycine max]|nr:Caffeoylshikimate esterase [Glycine max]